MRPFKEWLLDQPFIWTEHKPMTFDQAKQHLKGAIGEDGWIAAPWAAPYLNYKPGDTEATLDGHFTADDLEAIAAYMRGVNDVINKAKNWRALHDTHVRKLEAAASHAFPPSGSDIYRPELWKDGHWLWLRNVVNV